MNIIFKQSMEVGYYFNKELFNDSRTEDWCGSEECSTFTKTIVDYAEENECNIDFAFFKLMNETINKINNESIKTEDHAWDEYCRGFLAGEILGKPNKTNLRKAEKAEELFKREFDKYGYYQEVLIEILKK